MRGYGRCERCVWVPIQQHTSVRQPPWVPGETSLEFQVCKRCGSVSVQRIDSADGFGSLWILSPSVMALIRIDAAPAAVFDYVLSEEFAQNRAITEGLFRGYVGAIHDLSASANTLIANLDFDESASHIRLVLDMLRIVLVEGVERGLRAPHMLRLQVAKVDPLLDLVRGRLPYRNWTPEELASLRIAGLEIVERFCHPALWETMRPATFLELEQTIDHGAMLGRVRGALEGAIRALDGDGPGILMVEARFMERLFRRRKAWLTRPDALLVWRAMHGLADRGLDDMTSIQARAYVALRELLERQLLEQGMLKTRDDPKSDRIVFQEPGTGRALHLVRYVPRVEVFDEATTGDATRILDSWADVMDWHTAGDRGDDPRV